MSRKKITRIGVLAFHGDVEEHIFAMQNAAKDLKCALVVTSVRTKKELEGLDALIIPGGESTTLQKLCEREGMFSEMKKIKNIFGTCAGAILLSKKVQGKAKGQRTLGLMDIEVARNAYGRQIESFEKDIKTSLGKVSAMFIRAPKIIRIGSTVSRLGKDGENVVACEQRVNGKYYMALTFHPELTSTKFHEYFLEQL